MSFDETAQTMVSWLPTGLGNKQDRVNCPVKLLLLEQILELLIAPAFTLIVEVPGFNPVTCPVEFTLATEEVVPAMKVIA